MILLAQCLFEAIVFKFKNPHACRGCCIIMGAGPKERERKKKEEKRGIAFRVYDTPFSHKMQHVAASGAPGSSWLWPLICHVFSP